MSDEQFYEPDPGDYEPGHWETKTVSGKLKPPFLALEREIEEIRLPLEFLMSVVQAHSLDVVVIFDGLDRLISPDKFWAVVEQDFRVLRQMRVAVLAAAPLSVLYGDGRSISEHFDRVHRIAALKSEPGNNSDLKSVLNHRGGTDLLGPNEAELICCSSGGVLRDLITLARDAGEAAYIDGSHRFISSARQRSASALSRSDIKTGSLAGAFNSRPQLFKREGCSTNNSDRLVQDGG